MKKKKDYCPICNTEDVEVRDYFYRDIYQYECPRCGDYSITLELKRQMRRYYEENPDTLILISSWIREQNEIGREVSLTTEAYERLKKDLRMPSVSEKQFKLMQALERRTRPGKWIDFRENKEALIAAGWCTSLEELIFWIKTLIERKLLKKKVPKPIRMLMGVLD